MENLIPIIIILALVLGATSYIIKQKKDGAKCIGCPHSKTCSDPSCTGEDNTNK